MRGVSLSVESPVTKSQSFSRGRRLTFLRFIATDNQDYIMGVLVLLPPGLHVSSLRAPHVRSLLDRLGALLGRT